MIQHGQTVMWEELGENNGGEAQDVEGLWGTGKGFGLQLRGDEELLKGLIGVVGQQELISIDSSLTIEALTEILQLGVQGFKGPPHPHRNINNNNGNQQSATLVNISKCTLEAQ